MMRVGQRAFERLVADALDSLPDTILQMLDNVAVVVADEPTAHQIQRVGLAADEMLLGLYEGIPRHGADLRVWRGLAGQGDDLPARHRGDVRHGG